MHQLALRLLSDSGRDWTDPVGSSTPVRKHRASIQSSVQECMFTGAEQQTARRIQKGKKPSNMGLSYREIRNVYLASLLKTNQHQLVPLHCCFRLADHTLSDC